MEVGIMIPCCSWCLFSSFERRNSWKKSKIRINSEPEEQVALPQKRHFRCSPPTSTISPFSFISIIFLILTSAANSSDARLLDTSVACDQHNFILSLNFDIPFRGLVYSEEGFPNCVYVNGTMLSHINYQLKIPLQSCETRLNADGNFENGIIIQDNVAFLQSTDKKYLLTCIPSKRPSTMTTTTTTSFPEKTKKEADGTDSLAAFGRENAVTVDFGGVTIDQSFTSTERIHGTLPPSLSDSALPLPSPTSVDSSPAAASPPELKYAVEIRAGHSLNSPPITAALNIGDQISYAVRLQKPVSESQIGRCWASDSKSSLELSDERGCSLQPRGNIWGQFERVETDDELVFVNRIKAWAFPTSNEVNIFCNLRVCMSRQCSFVANCTENAQKSDGQQQQQQQQNRRRREGGEFAEVETLKTKIQIRPKRSVERSGRPPALLTSLPGDVSSFSSDYSDDWCLSLFQLFLLGACCCAASVCASAGAAIAFFVYCRGKDSEWAEADDGGGGGQRWAEAATQHNVANKKSPTKLRGGGTTTTRHAI